MNSHALLVDGVLVINLDDRADRWREVLQELATSHCVNGVRRFSATKGVTIEGYGRAPLFRGRARDKTWAGRAGCVLSHRGAIAFAAREGWKSVLILEDDIELVNEFEIVCVALVDMLHRHAWDICYLGFTDPVGPFRKVADIGSEHSLFRLYGCSTTHAYLVRDTAYDSLLRLLPGKDSVWVWLTRYRAIDRWYARMLSRYFKVLAVTPSIINQKQGISDITGRAQEYGHCTQIPDNTSKVIPFNLAATLRRAIFLVQGGYDAVRGYIKRIRGF